MKRIEIEGRAAGHIDRAYRWYEREREGFGTRFNDAIGDAVEAIGQHPQSFAFLPKFALRRALVRTFPYAIYFRELDDRISILAVLHTARDVGRGLGRRATEG